MNGSVALACALAVPFLAFVPYFTPPEWWFNVRDERTFIGSSTNYILNSELRLGRWYHADGSTT